MTTKCRFHYCKKECLSLFVETEMRISEHFPPCLRNAYYENHRENKVRLSFCNQRRSITGCNLRRDQNFQV